MRILHPITSKKTKFAAFESILSILYSVSYCVRDAKSIPFPNMHTPHFRGLEQVQSAYHAHRLCSCQYPSCYFYQSFLVPSIRSKRCVYHTVRAL